jgi:hypothetical protein
MIYVELSKKDLVAATRTEVRNLPGMLFGGNSPLLKPFMKKLEDLLPEEKKGRGDSYILNTLYSHIDSVHADEGLIQVKSNEKTVDITRAELAVIMEERYPLSDHHMLNLPGLLFLQSSPGLQACAVSKAKAEYNLHLPEGRRTHRFVFHMIVIDIDANKEAIKLWLDLDRLPKKAEGSRRSH